MLLWQRAARTLPSTHKPKKYGRAWIKDSVEGGATFYHILPAYFEVAINVLIVDDHSVSRRGLREILLESQDIQVQGEATRGSEALAKLKDGNWDVVILDIGLPGENGLEVLKQIKTHWPQIAVIAFSSFPEEYYGLRMLEAGAAGYLMKDGPAEELVEAVRKVASGGKYIRKSQIDLLAQNIGRSVSRPPHFTLSEREFQVFCLIGSGLTVKQVSTKLSLSDKTVATYRQRILEKMNMHSNLEIVRYVVENRLDISSIPR